MLKAPALKKHDRIGLVCPASRPDSPVVLKRCQQIVEDMGFVPVVGKSVMKTHGYMAGTDEERLEDLMSFLHDDSIAGIFCVTGGFGSMHLLPYLEYKRIAVQPKVIVGGDDNTSLLTAIHARSGLVTFVGPNLDQINSKYSFERFRDAVTGKGHLAPVTVADVHSDGYMRPVAYSPVAGDIKGRLLGGNLTALVSLMGTEYQPNFEDAILFLEDRDERNDILDRWFTTLYVSGELGRLGGIAFGQFENCSTKASFNMLSLEELFGDRLCLLHIPSCFGFPIGQGKEAATVPLGVTVHLDTEKARLEFLEPALA